MKYLKIMITILIMLGVMTVPASANSALMYWHGSDNGDVYALSEDCPLQVSHEKLIFSINQLPQMGYNTVEDFNSLDSSVTAVYTFHNPANYDVNATLYFPFGNIPHYAPGVRFLSPERYSVVTDGKKTDMQLRFHYQPGEFNITTALKRLRDEKISDGIFTENTVLTRYDYQIDTNEGIYCDFTMANDKIALISRLNAYDHADGKSRFGVFYMHEEEMTFSLYLIGEENYIEGVHFYQSADRKEEVDNRLILTGSEKIMLADLMDGLIDIEGISETDRYNCFICWLRDSVNNYPVVDLADLDYLLRDGIVCGYVYKLSVPAGGDVINEVTAPLYPSIDGYYDPYYYDYLYLSSPAKTWSSFGSLDIEIRTSYNVSQFSAGDLTQDKDGVYRAQLQGLPEKEITFRVCEVEQPDHIKNSSYNMIAWIIISIMALGAIGIIAVLAMIIKAFRRSRR